MELPKFEESFIRKEPEVAKKEEAPVEPIVIVEETVVEDPLTGAQEITVVEEDVFEWPEEDVVDEAALADYILDSAEGRLEEEE